MTQEDISRLDHPNHYKKRESPMNAWLNVIYKMMADGCSNELIYFYIKRQKAFHESERNLADYIYLIGKNNFPDRTAFYGAQRSPFCFRTAAFRSQRPPIF